MAALAATSAGRARGARRLLRVAAVVITVVVAIDATLLLWKVTGGQWRIVETPSMGTWAPVGTLLWVKPVAYASIRVGQVISFHPPTAPGETVTHRVVAVHADGSLSTRGDINGAIDPWVLHRPDVLGRVEARWWYAGWVVHALPMLLLGGLAIWALTAYCTPSRLRLPARVASTGALLCVTVLRVRPLFEAKLIGLSLVPGGARAQVIGTGVLPVRINGNDGSAARVGPGTVGQVVVRAADGQRRFVVHIAPQLSWVWTAGILALAATPLVVLIVADRRHRGRGVTGTATRRAGTFDSTKGPDGR